MFIIMDHVSLQEQKFFAIRFADGMFVGHYWKKPDDGDSKDPRRAIRYHSKEEAAKTIKRILNWEVATKRYRNKFKKAKVVEVTIKTEAFIRE